ncbi:MAG: malto-oligosyltrehalose trehalohydrolase [Betaproteobacteria bacterium]
MKRAHAMPFGSTLRPDGIAFRLWAPGAMRVELVFEEAGAGTVMPMTAAGQGWFEHTHAGGRAGARYRYRIDGGTEVPDPASRHQPQDAHGPSEVIDPRGYDWRDAAWCGRPWHEAVIYELHVGTFTREGTFEAAARRLEYLRDLGVTVVELMPVADFPGARNWGYDGVLPYAPESRYGRPEALKQLIDDAHALGLAVMLDVVYNHFGPDGNYLHVYAHEHFFNKAHQTPWGAAINFDGAGSPVVRDFFIHNALYWLEEFHFDGLRLDAVHAICDDSEPDILVELAEAVRRGPGRGRHVHLVLENDDNAARYLGGGNSNSRARYDAQWNDDAHHAFHVVLTGERDGYYADYADQPLRHLGRALTEGFVYQGEVSRYRRQPRGEPSRHLPLTAFVAFLQNHDQVGNRAYGERMSALARPEAVRAGLALLLLVPSVPLLFMGEEFGCMQPFPFFCDFDGDLARAVTDGRRREFASFARFQDPGAIESIPDPNAPATFQSAVIDWDALKQSPHADWHAYVRDLLGIRQRDIVPRLPSLASRGGRFTLLDDTALSLRWQCADGSSMRAVANLGEREVRIDPQLQGRMIFCSPGSTAGSRMPPWWVAWCIEPS